MKQLFLAIAARLKTVPNIQYIHLWNDQLNQAREGKEYAFRFPAVFIEFVAELPIGGVGNNVQLYEPLEVRLHICMDQLDTGDGNLEQNLDIFDFKQAVYKKMQLFQCNGSSPFDRQGEEPDYAHDNLYHYIQKYMTTYVDQDLPLPIDGIEANPPFITEITPIIQPVGPQPIPVPTPSVIGTLVLNQFNSSDYTVVGSASPTFNAGTSITLSGGATSVNDYIRYNGFISSRNHLKRTIRFTVDTFNTSSYGIGPKWVSVNSSAGSQFNNTVFGVTSNNSEKGKIYWYGTQANNTDGAPSDTVTVTPININLNNTLELIVEQLNFGFTMTMFNLTLDPTRLSPASHFYQMPTAYPFVNGVYHNTSKIALAAFGGTQTVIYDKTETNEYEYCDLAIIGDSKASGLGCASVTDRFGSLWESNNLTKKISVFSGSSDKTNEVVLALPDIIKSKPKKVIMFIGRNDIANSILSATWQANYSNIVSALAAVGSDVYHQLPTTEGILDQSALTTYLNTTYPGKTIPIPTGWVATTDNVNDTSNYIHPNTGGHLKIYNTQALVIAI